MRSMSSNINNGSNFTVVAAAATVVAASTTTGPIHTDSSLCENSTNLSLCVLGATEYHLGPVQLTIGIALAIFILCIIIGNSFVILSVTLFREMRTLSNGIIVSLASADLLVAIIVLPISLQQQLTGGEWILGRIACDFWVTADVFFCTSSILNICVIAVDRYWLITKNVRYTHNTTFPRSRVVLLLVTTAWILSGSISAAPLMGWSTGQERANPKQCIISQDYAYTIFSTFGAFWFPLLSILLIYFRIFSIARARYRRRSKAHNVNNTNRTDNMSPAQAATARNNNGNASSLAVPTPEIQDDLETTALCNGKGGAYQRPSVSLTPPASPQIHELHSHDNQEDIVLRQTDNSQELSNSESREDIPQSVGASPGGGSAADSPVAAAASVARSNGARSLVRVAAITAMGKRIKRVRKTDDAASTSTYHRSRQRSHTRNSARTLGLIIGGFVLCWLPFFIMATIMPFCHTCRVPPGVVSRSITFLFFVKKENSVVLWLGYSNSLLNPAIYAIWDKSFRRSFRRLATCDIRWANIL